MSDHKQYGSLRGPTFTTEPDPERVKALAALLHEQQIGCLIVPPDPYFDDVPWKHTGDHEAVARAILEGPIRQIDPPDTDGG